MALAKSVNKLLLAASASKARLIVVNGILCSLLGYFTFAFRNGPRKGHYSSQIQINAGGQNGATIRVTSWAIIDIRHAALDRYGTHQKTISRRPEQMYSPSDIGLGLAWGGSLFTSVSNRRRGTKLRLLFKSFPGSLLKSGMGPLARYSNHQEIINRRPEQMYTSFDTRLEWPREGPLFELDLNKRRGPKRGHYSSQLLGHY